MEEQLITFETAKLAKEKGFKEYTIEAYYDGELSLSNCYDLQEPRKHTPENETYAPTQSLLQKWLREVHKIDICISLLLKGIDGDATGYFYVIYKDLKEIYDWQDRYGDILEASEQDVTGNHVNQELYNKLLFEMNFAFHTYEEALELGLQKALDLIK